MSIKQIIKNMYRWHRDIYLDMKHYFKPKKGILVYVGLNRGASFNSIFRNYNMCYGFEPNPELFNYLSKKFNKYENVQLFNYAVGEHDEEVNLNISNNDGASSSLGNFSEEWENFKSRQIKMIRKVNVQCVNLHDFLKNRQISLIDSYVSDIQGYDLQVLKTLKPYIVEKSIKNITCEVAKNKYGNIYSDLPDNSEDGFANLLSKNYKLIAKGWGVLKDGEFNEVPESWWEMDCKWTPK